MLSIVYNLFGKEDRNTIWSDQMEISVSISTAFQNFEISERQQKFQKFQVYFSS